MFKRLSQVLFVAFISIVCMYGCASSSVTTNEAQKCEVIPPEQPFACTMDYRPVCGCDGKTYGNACGAKAAGVPESTAGACEQEDLK